MLGDVAGKDVLELGCGAAEWSRALARARRARHRARQLRGAARACPPGRRRGRLQVTLVHASAESDPARPMPRSTSSWPTGARRPSPTHTCSSRRLHASSAPVGSSPSAARRRWRGWPGTSRRTAGASACSSTTSACTAGTTRRRRRVQPAHRRLDPPLPGQRLRHRGSRRGPAAGRRDLDLPRRGGDRLGTALADGADLEGSPALTIGGDAARPGGPSTTRPHRWEVGGRRGPAPPRRFVENSLGAALTKP